MDGKTQAAAAAASSMSLRTAREWDTGPVPSATKQPRDWRTRPDPFAAVWLTDVEPLLRSDAKGVLEAKVGAGGVAARGIPSSFTRGRRGPCSDGFATGGRGTASSPRCSSSKSPCPVARRRSISRMRPTWA